MDKFLLIKIIYGAASIQGLFLGWLLFRSKINQPADRILSILIFIVSFHLILVGFDEREFFITFPHLSKISWILGTIYGPLIFLFIQSITRTLPKAWWKNTWLLIPFIIVLTSLLPYYLLDAEAKIHYLDNFAKASEDDFGWINQFVSIVQVAFQFLCLAYYHSVERKASEEFSSVESVRIQWLRKFLIFLCSIVVLGVLAFFGRLWNWPLLSDFYHFHFIGVVFLFYWLSYKALSEPVLFGIVSTLPEKIIPAQEVKVEEEKYKKSTLEQEELNQIFGKLKNLLEEEKIYLKKDLTLTDLSDRSGISKHQISQAINSSYSGNFFDLINDYRIEEFKRLAQNPANRHLSLLGIAQESGFNSKATFYAVFKKKTGLTPTEFLTK
ncbi:MAG TPA: helix-turn-helix transcriptional regulator [Cyclobacteriaceae bacterium]